MAPTPADLLELADYRRRVAGLYAAVRAAPSARAAWELWRAGRDELFGSHPQSALPEDARPSFAGLSYFAHDPAARVLAEVVPAEPRPHDIAAADGSTHAFTRFALARFELAGESLELELYWLEGYAGGVFLPFADLTSGSETYGGGRYLLDGAKGADLGLKGGRLVLDFNFAYHPSCAYDPRWACPLAPAANRLPVALRAGERLPC
jgi:uncharacterized protein (DUF1684 family)